MRGLGRRSNTLIILSATGVVLLLALSVAAFLLYPRTAGGAVVSLTSGEPIAGAIVRGPFGEVKTDDAGRFALGNLRLGTYPLTVMAKGFAPFNTSVKVGAFGRDGGELKLPDASVTVRVKETALAPKPVKATVSVRKQKASAAATGTYVLKGIPTGTTTITVSAPNHMEKQTAVDLKPGTNEIVVHMSLTPAETYVRYFEAYKSRDWKTAYAYLHPDVAKVEPLATFTEDMKGWGTPGSIKMGKTRMLKSWTSPQTHKTYREVAEIHRTLFTDLKGARMQSALPQHWVYVEGLWLRVDL